MTIDALHVVLAALLVVLCCFNRVLAVRIKHMRTVTIPDLMARGQQGQEAYANLALTNMALKADLQQLQANNHSIVERHNALIRTWEYQGGMVFLDANRQQHATPFSRN